MKKFFLKIKIDWFLVLLITIGLFLCYKNYTPKTFLSGWDTLHPEFNLSLYWQRITSVWQSHQGLGAPPSQAHASEIPRMPIVVFLQMIFTTDFVRYAYFFLMIIIGPVGVYFFLDYLTKEKLAAFLGSLFYLLNIGTMQHFVVPLEMFATKFGYLGFIFLYATKFIDGGKKRQFWLFLFFVIMASPMAHTATLWYVFFLGLALYLISYSLLKKKGLKKAGFLLLATIIVNLYWILPNVYYSFNYGQDVINSKIHRLFTEEAYFHNKKYGQIDNFLIFKNFLFDWSVVNNQGKNYSLLNPWINHLNNPNILFLAYLFSLFSILGLIVAIRKKNAVLISFIPILLICSFFLLSSVQPASSIFDWLRNQSAFFKEILRFPFTKFSLYLIFIASLFFGYFHSWLIKKISEKFKHNNLNLITSLYAYFFIFSIIIYSLPAFQGAFISPVVRVAIPQEYFSLFNWSKNQDQGRILILPFQSLFGWIEYRWPQENNTVYQGAGFTWFGLKQPTLNREFDRWYPNNEQAYREFFYALNAQNTNLFESLLKKYRIKYVLLDENVFFPGAEDQQIKLQYPQIKDLINGSQKIKLKKTISDKINIYEFSDYEQLANDLGFINNPKGVAPNYLWNYVDQAYLDYGDYFGEKNIYYPGRNVLTEKERINKDIVTIDKNYVYRIDLNGLIDSRTLEIPPVASVESEFYSEVHYMKYGAEDFSLRLHPLLPTSNQKNSDNEFALPVKTSLISINDQIFNLPQQIDSLGTYLGEVLVNTQKNNFINFYSSQEIKTNFNLTSPIPYLCSETSADQLFGTETTNNILDVYGKRAKICLDLPLSEAVDFVEKNSALKISFDYNIERGTEADLCLFDTTSRHCLVQTRLKKFIFPDQSYEMIIPVINNLNSLQLRLIYDTNKQNNISSLIIKNFKASYYQNIKQMTFLPDLRQEKNTSSLTITGQLPMKKINLDINNLLIKTDSCSNIKPREYSKKNVGSADETVIEYQTKDGSLCDFIKFPDLSQDIGYLLAIESKNIYGLPIKICFEDDITKRCVLEDRLSINKKFDTDFFLIPSYKKAFGYNLILENYSIGDVQTTNQIKKISLIPFPYRFFQTIKWETEDKQIVNKQKVLILNQAYEKGWLAFDNGQRLKNHVLVDNWANGWTLPQDFDSKKSNIVILFWPQYLEYAGFIAIISFLILVIKNKNSV